MGLVARIISVVTAFSSSEAQPIYTAATSRCTEQLVVTGMCKIEYLKEVQNNENSQVVSGAPLHDIYLSILPSFGYCRYLHINGD